MCPTHLVPTGAVELELSGATNRGINVCCESLRCRGVWCDSDMVVFFSVVYSSLRLSSACDVRDSTDCWGNASGRLRTRRSPSRSGHRGCTRTIVSCTQPTCRSVVTQV